MAEEEKIDKDIPSEKKSSNLLMIIIIVVLILIILIGAVVGILLMGGSEEEATPKNIEPQVKEQSAKKTQKSSANADLESEDTRQLSQIGILYPMDTFTVNLKSDAGRRYLKVTMSIELEGEELSLELDNKKAVLRDRIIRILTSKTLEEISSKKGKQKVSVQIMDTLNAMISDGKIKGIYFTEFVIQ
jgi:flagellar FliL protein